ncbi:hypothetical protein ABG067_001277 [Albugo candida]
MLLLKRLKKQELFSSIHGESDIVQHQLELKDNFLHDKENFSILLATKANDHGNESSNIKMDGKQLKAFILNIFQQLIKAVEEFSPIFNFIAFDDLQLLVEDLTKLENYSSYSFQILDSTAKQKIQKRYKNNEGFVLQSVVSKLENISKPKARLRLFETIVFYLQLADEISTVSETK